MVALAVDVLLVVFEIVAANASRDKMAGLVAAAGGVAAAGYATIAVARSHKQNDTKFCTPPLVFPFLFSCAFLQFPYLLLGFEFKYRLRVLQTPDGLLD